MVGDRKVAEEDNGVLPIGMYTESSYIYVYIHICMYMYIFIYIHMHLCICTLIDMYTYICMYVCSYINRAPRGKGEESCRG